MKQHKHRDTSLHLHVHARISQRKLNSYDCKMTNNLGKVDNSVSSDFLSTELAGLGFLLVVALGAAKYRQTPATKFFQPFVFTLTNLSKVDYSVLPRVNKLDVLHSSKAIALVGERRSGASIFLSDSLLNNVPWWCRIFVPLRGVFLSGSTVGTSKTIDTWLKNQLPVPDSPNPLSEVIEMAW